MSGEGRKRRIAKWTGLVLLLPMIVLWAASFAWFYRGKLELTRSAGGSPTPQYHSFRFSLADGDLFFQHQPLQLHESYLPYGIYWRDRKWSGRVHCRELFPQVEVYANGIGWDIRLPGWIPILIVAVPTTVLWWPRRNRAPRKWRLLVRTGLVVSVLIGAAWGISLPYAWRYDKCVGRRADSLGLPLRSIYLHAGCLWVDRLDLPLTPFAVSAWKWHVERDLRSPAWRPGYLATGRFCIPLWIVLLLVALPTSVLRFFCRVSPHHCQCCGYNLTGNMSGVCPECGEKTTTRNADNHE